MNKKVKYQSIKVYFPKNLYLASTWLVMKDGVRLPYPHQFAYINPKAAIRKSKNINKSLKSDGSKTLTYIIIAKLKFLKKKPLKKSYWENPNFEYDSFDRMKQFIKPIGDPSSYKILVTPADAKKNILAIPMAFLNSTPEKDIELFMHSSDWYVDPLADSLAFYKIVEVHGVDLATGKVVNKDEEDLAEKLVN